MCEYLSANGWSIDVYTERTSYGKPVSDAFEHTYPIHEITIYRTKSMVEWAMKSLAALLFDWRNRFFSRQVRKAIAGNTYDMVLCCTFSTFPLRAAADIAKERNIPLHVDLRDVDEQVPGAQYQSHRQWWLRPFRTWYRNTNIRRRNKVIRQANALTSVSPWHVDFLKQFNSNVSLIYNGFDSHIFAPADVPTDRFTIAYVGRLYEQNMQDPTLLFEALKQLPSIPVKIEWYTNDVRRMYVQRQARCYGVEDRMEFHDYVPLNEVPDILHQASILLVLSNDAKKSGAHGIMTTKFFEALGVEKPVLCVRSDEECLAQVIRETNAGIAATNVEQVKTFIEEKYREWKSNGFTRQPVQNKERFTREFQARQFEELLSQFTSHIPQRSGHTSCLSDICWTLFSSNTTYDFLNIRGSKFNSLFFKLFGVDLARKRAVRKLKGLTRDELLAKAETFYSDFLEPRKINAVWETVNKYQKAKGDLVLVSGTLDIIAQVVAKHIGAKAFYATPLEFKNGICTGRYSDFLLRKKELLSQYHNFDVITDNLIDMHLIRRAKKAIIITYNNRERWEKVLPEHIQTTFIDGERDRY